MQSVSSRIWTCVAESNPTTITITPRAPPYYYLIIVDSFSKWPEVNRCKNPTTEITIKFLYDLFARFGVVDTLVSDNGSQFTSGESRDFCETY